ncbi:MAG: DUF1178 family protein [Pseudomonadota bacterium]|nr:DUF1178 family protein [Pseudomonadota bacterium]
MIKYQLICDQSHEFEGWFQSSVAYDEQAASGLLCCPICDSDQVKRALMAPNIASAKRRKTAADQSPASETNESARAGPATPDWHEASAGHAATPGRAPVLQAEQVQAYGAALAELRQLRQKLIKNCRDVGDNFAEEARKIHYGEVEAEGIYGQTTEEEREALKDEGIEIFDMPWAPSDH